MIVSLIETAMAEKVAHILGDITTKEEAVVAAGDSPMIRGSR